MAATDRASFEQGRQQAFAEARAVIIGLMPRGSRDHELWVDALARIDALEAESLLAGAQAFYAASI